DDDSLKLSGGEWQKIAIARALYKKGQFLLFDEPLSAIDPIAEAELYQDLMKVLEDRGAILVSHRLGSARQAERIIVMSEGQIVEEGSHQELIEKDSFYAEMFNEQSKWYR
ncbi:MAG: ATP-binding cassette domain-containing protein, partial [Eubacteriales bacterium]|nr:ATP-binding cassette domain-containing protein [Eubacteriales bacterium]